MDLTLNNLPKKQPTNQPNNQTMKTVYQKPAYSSQQSLAMVKQMIVT